MIGGMHILSPISFIFMQFSTKILPTNRFLPQSQKLVPPVWEILDPTLLSVYLWNVTHGSGALMGAHQGHMPPLGPISFNFIQFLAKILLNNRFLTQI